MKMFAFGKDNPSLAERLPTPDLSLLFTDVVTACDRCEILKIYMVKQSVILIYQINTDKCTAVKIIYIY
jgi:hypothetical protein